MSHLELTQKGTVSTGQREQGKENNKTVSYQEEVKHIAGHHLGRVAT